jgi:hypothetical protein
MHNYESIVGKNRQKFELNQIESDQNNTETKFSCLILKLV